MKKIIKVGIHHDNDIVIEDENRFISRYHMVIEIENNKVYLKDISSNGIWLNGDRIKKEKKYRINSADVVMLANRIPFNLSQFFLSEKNQRPAIHKKVQYSSILFLLLIIFISIFTIKYPFQMSDKEINQKYYKSVVLIYQEFVFKVSIEKQDKNIINYIGVKGINKKVNKVIPFSLTGTGFFISQNGHILTNRHVAEPWNKYSKNKTRLKIEKFLKKLYKKYGTNSKIEGISTSLGIITNGEEIPINNNEIDYNKLKSIIHLCKNINSSNNKNIDIALIQTLTLKVPENTSFIDTSKIVPIKNNIKTGEKACIIGYPAGLLVGAVSRGNKLILESTLKCGQVSQVNDDYILQYDISSTNGASGSPVISDRGYIIAINFSLLETTGAHINYGVKSEHIISFLKENGVN